MPPRCPEKVFVGNLDPADNPENLKLLHTEAHQKEDGRGGGNIIVYQTKRLVNLRTRRKRSLTAVPPPSLLGDHNSASTTRMNPAVALNEWRQETAEMVKKKGHRWTYPRLQEDNAFAVKPVRYWKALQ
jgi:hypothetical protein